MIALQLNQQYLLLQSIRYNMIEALLNTRDQFTLANIHLYLSQNNIEPFVFFANYVPIKSELSIIEETAFDKIVEPLDKAVSRFGVKIISPFRTLMVRLIQNNWGFTVLHMYFLRICKVLSMPSEALPILKYPGFFKTMKRSEELEFLIEACDLYIQLRRYEQAYKVIIKAEKLQTKSDQLQIAIYKKVIVLSIFVGKPVNQFHDSINKLCSRIEAKLSERFGEFQKKSKVQPFDYKIFTVFLTIKEWRELSQDEALVLSNQKLLDVFNASRYGGLGRYIENEVKGMNWRIKAQSVKNIKVGELDVIKGVNQNKEIYKYDSQEKIMYFNHRVCDQNQLNELISKAIQMQHQANNCKVEKKEELTRSAGMFAEGLLYGGLGKRKSRGRDFDDDDDE